MDSGDDDRADFTNLFYWTTVSFGNVISSNFPSFDQIPLALNLQRSGVELQDARKKFP